MGRTKLGPAAQSRRNDRTEVLAGATFSCDSDFRITDANAAACGAVGATPQALIGRNICEILEGPGASDFLDDPSRIGAPTRLRRSDGSTFWAMLACKQTGANWSVQIFDIRSLVEGRDELVYRESMWRHAIEATNHGVWDYNVVTDKRFYSVGWKRLRGFPDDAEVVDTVEQWQARVHPDDLEFVQRNVDDHNSGRVTLFSFEYRERRLDGRWIWILSCGSAVEWNEEGRPTRFTGTDTDITDLKQSETAVAALSSRLELALSTSGVGVWEIDLETRTFTCDRALAEMWDFATGPGEGLPLELWKKALHPDDLETAARKAEQAIMSGEKMHNVFRIVRRDGEVRHIESSGAFHTKPDGTQSYLGVDRDITEEQRRAEALSAHSMQFEAAIENMGHGLSMFDGEGRLIVANRYYADLYGFPGHLVAPGTLATEMAGYLKDTGTLEAEVLKTATNQALKLGNESEQFDRTWRLANGQIVYYTTTPLSTGGWVSIHRDVTAKYLADRQLAESEERFRDFTTTASDWCWETDPERLVTYLTNTFEQGTGISPTQIVGRNLADIPVHGDDREMMRRLFDAATPASKNGFKDVLLRMDRPDGTVAHLNVSGVPKFDETGTFLGFRGTGTDVSLAEQRKAELAEAESLLKRRTEQLIEAQQIGKIGDWAFTLGDDSLWWAPETFVLMRHDAETFVPTYDAVMAVYLEDGAKRVLASQADVVRSGGIRSVDVKARRADGSIGDYVVTSKGRTNASGDIIGFYGTIQDISERKYAEEQLERLAYFDPLTGLANRALFQREGDALLRASGKKGTSGGLLLLDLDRFKEVNDSLGHGAGDELLNKIARKLSAVIGQRHFLARLGGDEFAIIAPEATMDELEAFAQLVNSELDGIVTLDRGEVTISTSIGMRLFRTTATALPTCCATPISPSIRQRSMAGTASSSSSLR